MSGSPATSTAVVHLVWGPLGVAPLRGFVRSYRDHDAGVPHELVVVFNGVPAVTAPDGPSREALLAELDGIPHRLLELERPVLDLVAYRQAAATLDHPRLCILNSYSRIQAPGWLEALERALREPGVGLAGASGSWASMRSYALYHLRLPSAYGAVWPDRRSALAELQALQHERTGLAEPPAPMRALYTAKALLDMAVGFPPFPARHIRTNAFIASRERLAGVLSGSLSRKVDAHRLESGRRGLTRAIEAQGLRALVVDRHGCCFAPEEWPDSETFWQGDQAGLMVADNQTETYSQAGPTRRQVLASFAWGERADVRARAGAR